MVGPFSVDGSFPFSLVATVVIDTILIATFLIYQRARRPDQDRVTELESLLDHERQKRHDDRVGRTRAERLLRERNQIESSGKFPFQPIGFIRSSFRDRRGTPRQSLLAEHARAELVLEPFVQAQSSLDGLADFSHVWVIGVFHENTDTVKSIEGRFKRKIAPPRLNGVKKGIFATRSPHRPNPLSLSIGRIVSISGNRILLAGLDLIDGTPVLDIKPYVGRYDALPDTACPDWIRCDFAQGAAPLEVELPDEVADQLANLAGDLQFYDDADAVRALIEEVLRNDIRSVYQRNRNALTSTDAKYVVRLDRLLIRFTFQDDHVIRIQDISLDGPVPAS